MVVRSVKVDLSVLKVSICVIALASKSQQLSTGLEVVLLLALVLVDPELPCVLFGRKELLQVFDLINKLLSLDLTLLRQTFLLDHQLIVFLL